jgi:hypothetical protein
VQDGQTRQQSKANWPAGGDRRLRLGQHGPAADSNPAASSAALAVNDQPARKAGSPPTVSAIRP